MFSGPDQGLPTVARDVEHLYLTRGIELEERDGEGRGELRRGRHVVTVETIGRHRRRCFGPPPGIGDARINPRSLIPSELW